MSPLVRRDVRPRALHFRVGDSSYCEAGGSLRGPREVDADCGSLHLPTRWLIGKIKAGTYEDIWACRCADTITGSFNNLLIALVERTVFTVEQIASDLIHTLKYRPAVCSIVNREPSRASADSLFRFTFTALA